jgi:hypothetical protein
MNSEENKLGLDLKIVPNWAKDGYQPAGPRRSFEGEESPRDFRDRRDDRPRRPSRRPEEGPGRRPGPGRPRGRPERPGETRPYRSRGRDRLPPAAGRDAEPSGVAEPAEVPVEVTFSPLQAYAKSVAAQIRDRALTFPLFELGRIFLRNGESYAVVLKGKEGTELWQIQPSGEVLAGRAAAERAAFLSLRGSLYEETRVPCDPPKGNWQSVVRCRLDGSLLCPVNYHAYRSLVKQLWRRKFASMPFEEFERSLETVRDEALVKAWVEAASSKIVWRRKHAGAAPSDKPADGAGGGAAGPPASTAAADAAGTDAAFASEAEAEEDFRTHMAGQYVAQAAKPTLSGSVARKLQDLGLRKAVSRAWNAEIRFPIHLVNGLRDALQAAGLRVFKSKDRVTFVSVTRPRPLDVETATARIAAIHAFILQNRGGSRERLFSALCAKAGAAAGDSAGAGAAPPPDAAAQPPPSAAPEAAPAASPAPAAPPAAATEPPTPKAQPGGPFDAESVAADLFLLLQEGYVVDVAGQGLMAAQELVGEKPGKEEPDGRRDRVAEPK